MTTENLIPERWTLSEAELATSVSALFAPKAYQSPGGRITVCFDPLDSSPGPAPIASAKLACGPRTSLFGLASWSLAVRHPAASGLDPERLPLGLRLALLDSLLQALLEDLSSLLGAEVSMAEADGAAWPTTGRALRFRIVLEGPSGKDSETAAIALPSDEDVRWLLARLSALPRLRRNDMGFLEVPCAILAGAVSLSAADVASLAPSDLIIPDDPPVLAGRAFLERPWHPWIVLGLEGGQAVVASLKPEDAGPKESGLQEIGMDDKLAPPKGAAQAEDKAAGDLSPPSEIELPLRFEIGRRMMALKELEALAPGAVIPLDNDPKSPLTVTCHGKPLAKGVLVDLGDGRLGVRLTDVGNANGQVTGPNSAPRP